MTGTNSLDIYSVELPDHAGRVVEWPRPDPDTIRTLSRRQCVRNAERLFDLLYELSLEQIDFSAGFAASSATGRLWLPSTATAPRNASVSEDEVLLKVAQHAIAHLNALIVGRRGKSRYGDILTSDRHLEFVRQLGRGDLSSKARARGRLLCAYFLLANEAHAPLLTDWQPFTRFGEQMSHRALHELATMRDAGTHVRWIVDLADELIGAGLSLLAEIYSMIRARSGVALSGPFGSIRVEELPLLAARAESMAVKYGAERVASIFDQQLALLTQSLGFIVVRARTGASTVDLVCVSGDPQKPFTFLLEAKTSKRPYGLPLRDQRALRDYVADVRSTLTTLPPLQFVLIIGHEGAPALSKRLRGLAGEVLVPCRFLSAEGLAKLRLKLPGPLPMTAFAAEVARGDEVLDDEFASRVVASYEKVHGAHEQFIHSLLD